jgi:hypothetical protein
LKTVSHPLVAAFDLSRLSHRMPESSCHPID